MFAHWRKRTERERKAKETRHFLWGGVGCEWYTIPSPSVPSLGILGMKTQEVSKVRDLNHDVSHVRSSDLNHYTISWPLNYFVFQCFAINIS